MANPIEEDVHTVDLHIVVGTRLWPDGMADRYCEVTFPSVGGIPPVVRNYMRMEGGLAWSSSLDKAIRIASGEIMAYLNDPEEWLEAFSKQTGPFWEKRRIEKAIEDCEAELDEFRTSSMRVETYLTTLKERLQTLTGGAE